MDMGHFCKSWINDGAYITCMMYCGRLMAHINGYIIGKKMHAKSMRVGGGFKILGVPNIKIGNGFIALDGLRLEAIEEYNGFYYEPHIAIGNNVYVGSRCHIGCILKIVIGNNVLCGDDVLIEDHSHVTDRNMEEDMILAPTMRKLGSKAGINIGNNVWLCNGVVVTDGVTIGDGAVVAANSVVCGNIPSYCLAAGAPARIIRHYNVKHTHEQSQVK